MIGGTKKEIKEFSKKVGLFKASVIAINPSLEDYNEILRIELPEDSKATEYLGESKDGNTYLRVDAWLEEEETKEKFKVSFFLEDKPRENKDGTKKQYINAVGVCSWADDPENLPDWFTKREYRVANVGEEEIHNFLRTWLGNLDSRNEKSDMLLEWKPLMKGNVKELREHIGGEWATPIVALATVITKEKDGEIKEYQGVYNKSFLSGFALKQFRLVDYMDIDVIGKIAAKKPKDRRSHEKFALEVMDSEYGCKDYFILKDLKDYNPEENLVASNKTISEEGKDY